MACHLVLEMYPDDSLSARSSLAHMLQGKTERNGQHNIEVPQVKVGIHSQYGFLQFGKLKCRVCKEHRSRLCCVDNFQWLTAWSSADGSLIDLS